LSLAARCSQKKGRNQNPEASDENGKTGVFVPEASDGNPEAVKHFQEASDEIPETGNQKGKTGILVSGLPFFVADVRN